MRCYATSGGLIAAGRLEFPEPESASPKLVKGRKRPDQTNAARGKRYRGHRKEDPARHAEHLRKQRAIDARRRARKKGVSNA